MTKMKYNKIKYYNLILALHENDESIKTPGSHHASDTFLKTVTDHECFPFSIFCKINSLIYRDICPWLASYIICLLKLSLR